MARLLLVRHGQASFFSENYDRLSPLGEEQARRLGAYLKARGVVPDRVFAGPLERQRRTAEIAAAEADGWPGVVELAGLREHQGDELVRQHLPALSGASPEIAALLDQPEKDPGKFMARVLVKALHLWAQGEFAEIPVETFAAFDTRVRDVIGELTRGSGLTLAFTSGGLIGAAVAGVLQSPARAAVDLGVVVVHTSMTEFLHSPGRVTLQGFNAAPHLDGGALSQR